MTPLNLLFNDKDVLKLLERIKDTVFYAFTNPFYHAFAPITSKDFEEKVIQISNTLFGQPLQQPPQAP